jgi:hypothetical protein
MNVSPTTGSCAHVLTAVLYLGEIGAMPRQVSRDVVSVRFLSLLEEGI